MAYYNKSKSDSWSTPTKIYNELNNEFNFDDFDPCPLNDNPEINGLKLDWAPTTFVNPPYSKLKTTKKRGMGWVEKAHIECKKNKTIVMLIPARVDTTWFHEIILANNYEVRFIKGRLKFGESKDSAPFPSMIVIFKN
ncbi:MAG: DNA N-6-adenine-methyltransferase [Cyanophyceae cyanobacterium]